MVSLNTHPDYPIGSVIGPCICGSWPGGECLKCPKIYKETKMADRFDLEQKILNTWKITSDLKLLAEREAPHEDFLALATVYEHIFDDLFTYFEQMIKEKCFTNHID
jgi:hypothetical protein